MGFRVKIQKINRPTNKSYYINFPAVLAQLIEVEKGEEFEWLVEDKNVLVLKRINKKKNSDFKNI